LSGGIRESTEELREELRNILSLLNNNCPERKVYSEAHSSLGRLVEILKKRTRVDLNYFKESGKWYTGGSYETEVVELSDIWKEVENKRRMGDLPGLSSGCGEVFTISVDVPDHEDNRLRLIPVETSIY